MRFCLFFFLFSGMSPLGGSNTSVPLVSRRLAYLLRSASDAERRSLLGSEDLKDLVELALEHREGFRPRDVASVMHALATMRLRDVRLLKALTELVIQKTDRFNQYDCALLLYSYAVLKVQPGRFIGGLVSRQFGTPELASSFKPQDLSMSLWALAKMGVDFVEHERQVLALAERLVPEMNQQALSNTLWALANLNVYDISVMGTAADRAAVLLQGTMGGGSSGIPPDAAPKHVLPGCAFAP